MLLSEAAKVNVVIRLNAEVTAITPSGIRRGTLRRGGSARKRAGAGKGQYPQQKPPAFEGK